MSHRSGSPALHAMTPYLLAAALFTLGALVQALGASLAAGGAVSVFPGERWLRVHLVTLGIFTELAFGVLAARAAAGAPRGGDPAWGAWASLNAGLLALLVGIPLANAAFIVAGGSLVLVATLLAMRRLARAPREGAPAAVAAGAAAAGDDRAFHLAALAFLLVGVTLGTGLWLGWDTEWLRVASPKEAHVHANGFGFAALALAGVLIRVVPRVTGRALLDARPRRAVLAGMVLGASGLVAGPWLGSMPITVVGLVAHVAATGALLAGLARASRSARASRGRGPSADVGLLHLFGAYAWFFAPLLVTPFVLIGAGGLTEAGVGANAPPTLVYGWMLQAAIALAPFYAARALRAAEAPPLGGSWWTLAAVNAGALLQWAAVLDAARAATWSSLAFVAWGLALAGLAAALWRVASRDAEASR